MNVKKVVVLGVLLVAGISVGVSVASEPGASAPDVTLSMQDGSTLDLASLQGRPVVLNFWASWCPACVAEMPDFQRVHEQLGDAVAFIGVNTQEVSAAAAAGLLAQTRVGYDIALDPRGELFRRFGGFAMPTTVFIGADGAVVDVHAGVLFADDLSARLAELLSS